MDCYQVQPRAWPRSAQSGGEREAQKTTDRVGARTNERTRQHRKGEHISRGGGCTGGECPTPPRHGVGRASPESQFGAGGRGLPPGG